MFQSLRRYHQPYYSNFKVVPALRMLMNLKKKPMKGNHGKVRRSRQTSRSKKETFITIYPTNSKKIFKFADLDLLFRFKTVLLMYDSCGKMGKKPFIQ